MTTLDSCDENTGQTTMKTFTLDRQRWQNQTDKDDKIRQTSMTTLDSSDDK